MQSTTMSDKRARERRRQAAGVLFYNVGEVADLLNISAWTVREMIKRGELPFARVGPLIRIKAKEFHERYGQPYQAA
jgi:excisionase family DNA binding protein